MQLFAAAGLVGIFVGSLWHVFTDDVADIEARCPHNDFWRLEVNPFR